VTVTDLTLPGVPPPTLAALYGALSPVSQGALKAHLLGGTSADWIAQVLRNEGCAVSATTIRSYRRSLEGGVQL
jgi:hypothetical protein